MRCGIPVKNSGTVDQVIQPKKERIVGTYETNIHGNTYRAVLLGNGVGKHYVGEKIEGISG